KAQRVIDPENVEPLRELAHAAPPPRETIRLHHVPAVERDAPILPPALHENVVLEIRLRRSAATPFEIELLRLKKYIRAAPRNSERHIAHQFHAARCRMRPRGSPLAEAEPLHVGVKAQPRIDRLRMFFPFCFGPLARLR